MKTVPNHDVAFFDSCDAEIGLLADQIIKLRDSEPAQYAAAQAGLEDALQYLDNAKRSLWFVRHLPDDAPAFVPNPNLHGDYYRRFRGSKS